MKEYLIKKSDGSYFNQMACVRESKEQHAKDWLDIPDGADFATGVWPDIVFRKDGFYFEHGRWIKTWTTLDNIPIGEVCLAWQRHPTTEVDNVNQPQHYCSHPSGIECIEITQHHDFSVGNAIKYLWRAGLKGSDTEVQDLKKAVWYIENKIKLLGSSDD